MENPITMLLSGSGTLILIFYGAIWILKQSTKKLLETEFENHKNKLSKELESYKRKLDLEYEKALDLQSKKRELFEGFSNSMENIFTKDGDELSLQLNKMFGLLALYAPDDVYKALKKSLDGMVEANKAKPKIYEALRKEIFGDETKLSESDLIKHIEATKIKTK